MGEGEGEGEGKGEGVVDLGKGIILGPTPPHHPLISHLPRAARRCVSFAKAARTRRGLREGEGEGKGEGAVDLCMFAAASTSTGGGG